MFRLHADYGSKLLCRRDGQKGGTSLETVGLDAGYGDVLESVQLASAELVRYETVPDVAHAAFGVALELTGSSVAFLVLLDEDGEGKRVFSRAADPQDRLPADDIERLFAVAGSASGQVGAASWTGTAAVSGPAVRAPFSPSPPAGGPGVGMNRHGG